MSRFRPHTRVTDPDGREWELYAYRFRMPRRRRRRLRSLPGDVVQALRATEWTIEAVSWAPYPLSHRWTTSADAKGQVLARVEGQLARGETPMPRNAKQLL